MKAPSQSLLGLFLSKQHLAASKFFYAMTMFVQPASHPTIILQPLPAKLPSHSIDPSPLLSTSTTDSKGSIRTIEDISNTTVQHSSPQEILGRQEYSFPKLGWQRLRWAVYELPNLRQQCSFRQWLHPPKQWSSLPLRDNIPHVLSVKRRNSRLQAVWTLKRQYSCFSNRNCMAFWHRHAHRCSWPPNCLQSHRIDLARMVPPCCRKWFLQAQRDHQARPASRQLQHQLQKP